MPDRRNALRHSDRLNGLDHLELAAGGRGLLLSFIRPAPEGVEPRHVVIEGGRPPRVTTVALQAEEEGEARLLVSLDRRGGPGGYLLRLAGLPGIDPRYDRAAFRFRLDQAPDCAPAPAAEPAPAPVPEIDYLARDYAGFRQLMLDRLSLTLPGWTERHVPDIGITLVEILAHAADHLAYWQDAVATEAYLGTARLRRSVRRHARLVDYRLHEGCTARAFILLESAAPLHLPADALEFRTADGAVFTPLADATVHPARQAMRLHGWGEPDAELPRGATEAVLVRRGAHPTRHLHPGMLLLLEAPGEPPLRHVVRLTHAGPAEDALLGQPLVALAWAPADALPFALPCGATVAHGNLVLAQHGKRMALQPRADAAEWLLEAPALGQAAPPPGPATPAAAMLRQDPREAMPRLLLPGWRLVPDLLASRPEDQDVVAEPEADGSLRLRFSQPAPAPAPVTAWLGNGPAGNVGADRIVEAWQADRPLPALVVRNPLPAQGGTLPEPLEAARLRAPRALHGPPRRAVTEADYAAIAERHPRVQRAAARLRWTGSRQLVQVALDPLGGGAPDAALVEEVSALLAPARRIGHVLEVTGARQVPLLLELAVELTTHQPRGALRAAVRAALLGPGGLFDPDRLSFGEAIHASRILGAVQAVPGVEAVRLLRLEPEHAGDTGAVAAGLLPIGPFEVACLGPGQGRLVLHLGGGR